MLIWLMAVLLFAMFAALGYAKGAIRMIFPLVGLFVAAMLALPLAPLLRPLVPQVGLTNPVWSLLLPPVVVFFLVSLIFIGVGFFGHAKVNLFYKYRTDDVQHMAWQRLNKRLGVCVGLVAGAVYSILIGIVVHVIGYLTLQVSPGDNDTSYVRYVNQARTEMQSCGLDKITAAFDPAPAWYYDASDLLGLLYHNPALYSRLASYPAVIALAERPEFQTIVSDADFQKMLAQQPAVADVVEHPAIQAVLGNNELLERLREIDLKDLNHYLTTGETEKYADTPILGRWELDPYLTFLLEKKRRKNMTAADVKMLRFQVEFVRGFKLMIAPDNTVRLKGPDVQQKVGLLTELARVAAEGHRPRPQVQLVQPAPQPAADPAAAARSSLMANRYGLRRGGGGGGEDASAAQAPAIAPVEGQPAPVAVAPPPANAAELAAEIAKLPMVTLAQGSWKEEGGRFIISFAPEKELPQFIGTRKSQPEAAVREERLYVTDRDQVIVLARF